MCEENLPFFDSKQEWILEKSLMLSTRFAENSASAEKQESVASLKILSKRVTELEDYSSFIKAEKEEEISQLKFKIDDLQNERIEIVTKSSIYEEQARSLELDKQRIEAKYNQKINEIQEDYEQEIRSLRVNCDQLVEQLREKEMQEEEVQNEIVTYNTDGSVKQVCKLSKNCNSELIKLNALLEQ